MSNTNIASDRENRIQQVNQDNSRASKNESKKSIFPQKLWRMVNDQQFESAVRWTKDGTSFLVFENPLRNMCLGKENHIFFTKQPKSFVRQLHLYGFRKINKNQFMHQYFQRDQPELIKHIKRTYKSTSSSSDKPEMCDPKNLEDLHSSKHLGIPKASCLRESQKMEQNSPQYNCAGLESHNTNLQTLPSSLGALVFSNNYDEVTSSNAGWYEGNYVDISYNYNEDSVLNLYNNDIYPNTCEDNNITL